MNTEIEQGIFDVFEPKHSCSWETIHTTRERREDIRVEEHLRQAVGQAIQVKASIADLSKAGRAKSN